MMPNMPDDPRLSPPKEPKGSRQQCTCGHTEEEHLHRTRTGKGSTIGECWECDGECMDYTPDEPDPGCEACGEAVGCRCDEGYDRQQDGE